MQLVALSHLVCRPARPPAVHLFKWWQACADQVASLSDATLQRLAAALREPLGFDRAKAEWLAEQLLQAGERGVLVAPNVLLDAYSRAKVRRGSRLHSFAAAVLRPCLAVVMLLACLEPEACAAASWQDVLGEACCSLKCETGVGSSALPDFVCPHVQAPPAQALP